MHDGPILPIYRGGHDVELLYKGENRGDKHIENQNPPLSVKPADCSTEGACPVRCFFGGRGEDILHLDLSPKQNPQVLVRVHNLSFRVALRREVTSTPELFFTTPRASLMAEENKRQGSNPPSDDEEYVPDSQYQEVQENPRFFQTAAIFVGIFSVKLSQFALFVSSLPNDERLGGDADFWAYASPLPTNYSNRDVKKFVLGVPYKFASHPKPLHPDQAQIMEIISDFDDILPLSPKDKEFVTPLVRGSFAGKDSRNCTFMVTELPFVRLHGGAPQFTVFKDQATSHPNYLEGGDSLLATRTGFGYKGLPFAHVANITSVIQHGNLTRVPVRDIPPTEFVNSVCKEFNVQLLIGGVDDPTLLYPLISNSDILLLGGISTIKNMGEYVVFVSDILTKKYPKEGTPTSIYSKVESFLEHRCIHALDRHTLLWPCMSEGMGLSEAHLLAQTLVKGDCRPLVIAIANGLTSLFPTGSALEANPEIFPSNLYEDVHIISGFVQVSNFDRILNKYSSKKSRNLVSFLVGTPWPSPRPWISSNALPSLTAVIIQNGTIEKAPDYNSDDQRISPQSLVVIIQSKMVRKITDALVKHRLCSFDILRQSALSPRWSYLSISPHNEACAGQLKVLLGANLVYCLPASIVTRPSSSEGVILVKTSESWSYRRGSPLHLGLLSEYITAEGVKPVFFPTSDFFLKGIFPKNADFPDFIQFLKNVNKKIGSPWFSVVRYGEKDYKLCEREYSSFVSKVAARGSSRDLPLGKRSNYIFIEGLSLFQNRAEISSFFSKDLGIPVLSCEWGVETWSLFWSELRGPPLGRGSPPTRSLL